MSMAVLPQMGRPLNWKELERKVGHKGALWVHGKTSLWGHERGVVPGGRAVNGRQSPCTYPPAHS